MEQLPLRKEYLPYWKRIVMLWGAFIACLVAVSVVVGAMALWIDDAITLIYISTAIQNIFVFILAGALTAYCITPRPLAMLGLDRGITWRQVAFTVAVMIVSMPAMNYLIDLNESIDLPDSALEEWLRATEESARQMTDLLLSTQSVPQLILTVLLVGVLTGLGEEVFFRGAQLRIFLLRGINPHVAIWVTAVLFSALHLQFYGFFPRVLLGAFFGYLAWKSGSLWLPVIAHALNNSLVVVFSYFDAIALAADDMEQLGVPAPGEFPWLAICSVLLTAVTIALLGKKWLAPQAAALRNL